MKDDQYYLQLATDEGNKKAAPYNFGAVIVKNGEIIAKDFSHVHEANDPSAHAEVSALRKAAQSTGNYDLDGAVMYGSHEPCLMCFSCAAWANIARVVYAIPASAQDDLMYEFTNVDLKDMATKLARRPISVELIPLAD